MIIDPIPLVSAVSFFNSDAQ